jgi:hypothetical protein
MKKFILLALFLSSALAADQLKPNQCLNKGKSLTSGNGCFRLIMQNDGNLVIYRKSNDEPIWNSNTARSCTNRACMQRDGNFVTYDCQNIPTWASGTDHNEGSSIKIQDDGNLVIYAWNSGRPIWASNTVTQC